MDFLSNMFHSDFLFPKQMIHHMDSLLYISQNQTYNTIMNVLNKLRYNLTLYFIFFYKISDYIKSFLKCKTYLFMNKRE